MIEIQQYLNPCLSHTKEFLQFQRVNCLNDNIWPTFIVVRDQGEICVLSLPIKNQSGCNEQTLVSLIHLSLFSLFARSVAFGIY